MKNFQLEEIDKRRYEEYLKKASNITLFHTTEWLKIIESTWPNVQIKYFAVVVENKIKALMPIIVKHEFGLKLGGSPLRGLFTPYLGPLYLDKNFKIDDFELINSIIRKERFDFFEIAIRPERDLIEEKYGSKKTILIDLTKGKNGLWKEMKAKTRNQVRQAIRYEVEIKEPKDLSDWLSVYFEMVRDVYQRQGLPVPVPINFYKNLWSILKPKDSLKVILAKKNKNNEVIAGGIFPHYKDTVYYLDGASKSRYHKYRANNLIQWRLMEWAEENGFKIYDMLGANIPSIASFKKGFGGQQVKYPVWEITPSLKGKVAWSFYKLFKKSIKKLGIKT